MKPRSLALASVGLLAAFSLSSCTSVQQDAARVNGHRIPLSDFEGDVKMVSTLNSLGTNTVPTANARQILSLEILIYQYEDRLDAAGTPISDTVRQEVLSSEQASQGFTGLPKRIQDLQLRLDAIKVAIQGNAAAQKPLPGETVWVNPAFGQYEAATGVVALGTVSTTPDTSATADTAPATSQP